MTEQQLDRFERENRTRAALAAYQGQPMGKMLLGEAGLPRYKTWIEDVNLAPETLYPHAQITRGWMHIEAAAAAGMEGERVIGRAWLEKADQIFAALVTQHPPEDTQIDEHALVQARALTARAAIPLFVGNFSLRYHDEEAIDVETFDDEQTAVLKLLRESYEQTESVDLLHEIHCQTIIRLLNRFDGMGSGELGGRRFLGKNESWLYCRVIPTAPRFRQEKQGFDAVLHTYTPMGHLLGDLTPYLLRISHQPIPGMITVPPVLLLETKKKSPHGLGALEQLIALEGADRTYAHHQRKQIPQAAAAARKMVGLKLQPLAPTALAITRQVRRQIEHIADPPDKPRFEVAPPAENESEKEWLQQQFALAREWLTKAPPDLDISDPDNLHSLKECAAAMHALHSVEPLSPQGRIHLAWLMAEVAAHSPGLQAFEETRSFLEDYLATYQEYQPEKTFAAQEVLAWVNLHAQWRNTSPYARQEGAGTYQRTIAQLSHDLAGYLHDHPGAALSDEMRQLAIRFSGILTLNGKAEDETLVTAVPPWRHADSALHLGRHFAISLLTDDTPTVGHIRVTAGPAEALQARDSGLGSIDLTEELLPSHWPVADVLAALSKRITSPVHLGTEEQALLEWFDMVLKPKVSKAIALGTY